MSRNSRRGRRRQPAPATRQRPPDSAPWPGRLEPATTWQTPAILGKLATGWGPLLIAVVAMGMLIWTWGTWPDVLTDFGRERYIPWRLAEGEVLYRDVAFYNGPLSQYFNALCFSVLGSSLRTLVFCNLAILWCLGPRVDDGSGIARPFPLLVLVSALALIAGFLPRRREEAAQRRFLRQISFLVFAAILLAKMILDTRIFHYGFILAMPAILLLTVAAFDWVPEFINRRGGHGATFAAAAAALLSAIVLAYCGVQAQFIATKTQRVGAGADAFWADIQGAFVDATVARLAGESSRNKTLAVLPGGVMINCLSGLRNPTPYINLMPVEMILFEEQRVLDSFQANPPDLIVLVHHDTSEYGFPFFGRDYGQRLNAWVYANYWPAWRIRALPLQDWRFGIRLLEKNERR
jgi:hypothetical protein